MTNPENKPVSAGPVIKWGHDTPLGETNWLWKPLIPYESVTLIQGDGGDGKTTMILTIAAMVSRGVKPPTLFQGKLCPSESCPPVTTFYLTSEDEISDTTLRRFIRAGGDTTRFAYSAELQHHMTLREDELRSAIAQTGCRLLIIDPLQAFLPEGTHLANVTKMRTVFTMLANLAKTTGVAIVLVGHLNKNESSKDIHRGLGSIDIASAVRSVLMVEMDRKDHSFRTVRAIKNNFDESDYTPIRLLMDEDRRLTFANLDDEEFEESAPTASSAPAPEPTKTETAAVLLRELLKDGPVPVARIHQLMNENGIGFRTAQRVRQRLGIVQDLKAGIYLWRLP